jgi:hypothetical protein
MNGSDRFGDACGSAVQAFLGRLVVIGHDRQAGVRTDRLAGRSRQFDGLARRVGTGAGDHGNTPGGLLDGHADQFAVLVDIDRRRLAGGADDHDAVGAFLECGSRSGCANGEVQAAILVHGRDDGDKRSGNHGETGARKAAFYRITSGKARRMQSQPLRKAGARWHKRVAKKATAPNVSLPQTNQSRPAS